MTDTDLHQPGPGPLRTAAGAAQLAQAVSGLVSIDGCRLADSGPLAPLARDIARSMTEAGLTGECPANGGTAVHSDREMSFHLR